MDFYSKYEQICNFFGRKLIFLCSDFLCSVTIDPVQLELKGDYENQLMREKYQIL